MWNRRTGWLLVPPGQGKDENENRRERFHISLRHKWHYSDYLNLKFA